MKLVLCMLVAMLGAAIWLPSGFAAEGVPPAPFGLAWESSKADVKKLGVQLAEKTEDTRGFWATANNLPMALSDTRIAVLFFGFNDKLWRIWSASEVWENDDSGLRAKKRFNALSELLTERYGASEDYSFAPTDDYYSPSDKFAYSLSLNKRQHAKVWHYHGIKIELIINARMNDTFYTLVYEHEALAEGVRSRQSELEKDAL